MKIPAILTTPLAITQNHMGRFGLMLGSLLIGNWLINDVVHVQGVGLVLVCAGAGIWWLSKPSLPKFESPISTQGWIKRCREVLEQFEEFQEEAETLGLKKDRALALESAIHRSETQSIALVSPSKREYVEKAIIEASLAGPKSLELFCSPPLSQDDGTWLWPSELSEKDFLLYALELPLTASDLIWLQSVPEDQPSWLLVSWTDAITWVDQLKALRAQLPDRWTDRVLRLNGREEDSYSLFTPVRRALDQPSKNIDGTRQRLLSRLHMTWQTDLELLRRERFRSVQARSQWFVAGAVFASPVPSTDLLSLAVVNGLMVKEMAKIWNCSWRPETLQVVARQLAGAAVAQGLVEWSGQALLGLAKLHSGSWVAAGGMQALSAAYLTRIVGRSMADWLALNNGVDQFDLEALKIQAPKLVAKAAEEERIDWTNFLKQASNWITNSSKQIGNSSPHIQAV